MLHIHNGDSTANTMKESGFPGEHFAFREALATGPTPQGLSQEEWFAVRAECLSEDGALDAGNVKRDLSAQDQKLRAASGSDEVIMWFEHDLFCQINMIYLLDHFSRQNLDNTRLSLICIGGFPGRENFRGLGELSAEQMASLFDTRREVTEAETGLAQKAWSAFRSPDPRRLEDLMAEETSALPYLRSALTQHLARFPSVRNGLGRAENRLLEIIATGATGFSRLCRMFFDAEPAYGLGDSQVWRDAKRMAAPPQPLIEIAGLNDSDSASLSLRINKSSFDITQMGLEVLNGKADFLNLNGIDLWLGGVHLSDKESIWRWDERTQKLVAT